MIIVTRQFYPGDHKEAIQIGPSRENGDSMVEIYTSGEKQEEYWGKISINLGAGEARELAKALIDAAKDAEENKY